MSVKNTLSGIGGLIIALITILFFVGLGLMFIQGAGWLSSVLLPWFGLLTWWALGLSILVVLPLAIPMATRGFASTALFSASWLFGITLWMHALVLTLVLWGPIAAFIGLFLAGVGVVPVAMLATLFKAEWISLLEVVVMLFMTFGARVGSIYLAESVERRLDAHRRLWVPQAVATAMLLWAVLPANPYAYYILLRWVCSPIFAYLAVRAHRNGREGWVWLLGVSAAIYNPLLPVHLTREFWTIVNLITAGLALASISGIKKARPERGA